MRIFVTLVVIALCSTVNGQTLKEKTEYNKSITALLGGMGQFRASESTVLKNKIDCAQKIVAIQESLEKLRALKMDNNLKYAENFYKKKKLYEENKKERKVTKLAQPKYPERLTSYSIYEWPTLFNSPHFEEIKFKIDVLMLGRTPQNSGVGSTNCREIQVNVTKMKELLKDYIHKMKPAEYLAAKKFLNQIEHESQFIFNPLDKLASFR